MATYNEYEDKEALIENPSIPDINKVKADDMNYIKYNLPHIGSSVDSSYNTNLLVSKNLWNGIHLKDAGISSGGEIISNASTNLYYIPIRYGIKYVMSFTDNSSSGNVVWGYANNEPTIGGNCTYNVNTCPELNGKVFEAPNNSVKYLCIRLRYDAVQLPNISNIQLEEGETPTTYEEVKPNSINVNGEKFTETIGVGTSVNSANRVNVVYSHNLFDKSAIKYGYAWNNSANSSLAVIHIHCKPNTDYSIKFTGTTGINITWLEKTSADATSYTALYGGISSPTTKTTKSTSGVITLQLEKTNISASDLANTTFMLVEGSEALDYEPYITPSIVVDNDEIYKQPMWVDKTSEMTINNSNINTDRTKLFVNESLRLVFLQVYYASSIASTTIPRPLQYPLKYKPAFVGNDRLWFPMIPSNGGAQTARANLNSSEQYGTYINILCALNTSPHPFGFIIYPY